MRLGIVTSLLSSNRRAASVEAQEGPLLALLDAAVCKAFSALCRPAQKNLAVLTVAFLRVLGAVRSGHGQLSLAALFRVLPTPGTPHAREKRLHRFLRNPRLDPGSVTDGLARLIFGSRGRGLWPILFDQTKAGATQALFAEVPFQGRALPLAVYTFQYPWQEKTARSQNPLEEVFLADIETALPARVRPVFLGDRGYARAALLRQSNRQGRLYTSFVDARVRASNIRVRVVSWRTWLGRKASPFVILECFIKRESASPSMCWCTTIRNSKNLGGY